MKAASTALHGEMKADSTAVRGEIAGQIGGLATQMRVLDEDVIGRIALLQESLNAAPKRRPKKK
jgi:hypothetical protein